MSHEKSELRCQDMPYLKDNAPTLPPLPDGVVLPTTVLKISGKPKGDEKKSPAFQFQKTKAAVNNDANDSPKNALIKWYEEYWRRINKTSFTLSHTSVTRRLPGKDYFATWSSLGAKGKHPIQLFTSVFVCPWTGERFLSGKLAGRQLEYLERDFDFGEQGAKNVETKTLVWYRKLMRSFCSQTASTNTIMVFFITGTKRDAENSAAGRALDCLRHRAISKSSVTVVKSTKYCTDVPYGTNGFDVAPQDITQKLTGVLQVYTKMNRPIVFKLPWKVVPLEERIPIRYGGEGSLESM